MPEESLLMKPARSISRWLTTSASFGSSFMVGINIRENNIVTPQSFSGCALWGRLLHHLLELIAAQVPDTPGLPARGT